MRKLSIKNFSDLEKIKDKISNFHIVFVSSDPYWFSSINQVSRNFHTFSFDFLENEKNSSLFLDLEERNKPISTIEILKCEKVKKLLERIEKPKIFTFKVKKAYERFIEGPLKGEYPLKRNIFAAENFENKISVMKFFDELSISRPNYKILKIKKDSFSELKKELGIPFVLQTQFSAAGEGTFLIKDRDDFQLVLKENEGRIVKASEFIEGLDLTINACTNKRKTISTQLFAQITGVNFLAKNELASCGTDFSFRVDSSSQKKAWEIIEKVGKVLREKNFRGIFGMDFVWDGEKLFAIEINPRMVASIPVFTDLEVKNKRIPLLAFHFLELLEIPFDLSEDILEKSKEKIVGSHIFLKATKEAFFKDFIDEKVLEDCKKEINGKVFFRKKKKFFENENFGRVLLKDSVLEYGNTKKLKAFYEQKIKSILEVLLNPWPI